MFTGLRLPGASADRDSAGKSAVESVLQKPFTTLGDYAQFWAGLVLPARVRLSMFAENSPGMCPMAWVFGESVPGAHLLGCMAHNMRITCVCAVGLRPAGPRAAPAREWPPSNFNF